MLVAGDFNLAATVRLLQRLPANPIDRWEDGCYLRTIRTPDGPRLVNVTNAGANAAPDLRLTIRGGPVTGETRDHLTASVRWMLGLDLPPVPIHWMAEMEPKLVFVTHALDGFRPPCFPDLFQTCLAVVPFQQLSLDAGIAILGRLVTSLSPALTVDGRDFRDFPTPEAIVEAPNHLLRSVGLSGAKINALQGLARCAIDGELNGERFQCLPTEAALAELQRFPGIGPWSASIILLRGLRRMDVFPPGDTGAARSLTALLGSEALLKDSDVNAFAERFGEKRGLLYFLFLGARQLAALE